VRSERQYARGFDSMDWQEQADRVVAICSAGNKGRGGQRKPDFVEPLQSRFHASTEIRMIIFLGRQSPDASSDLPGSRNGSGRSVND
jgi:hypothetical protein